MYNYLSWHVHTNSTSILQLKNMWNDNFYEVTTNLSLSKLNIFTSFLISDIVNAQSSDLKDHLTILM